MGKNVHVVPSNGKWGVRKEGSDRLSSLKETQKEAIERGRAIAKNQESELFIHGRDGKIRERNSYGNDPYPPAN